MRNRQLWHFVGERNAEGAHILTQIPARPTALPMSLASSLHPFSTHRSDRPLGSARKSRWTR
jgi:hypothetical protein